MTILQTVYRLRQQVYQNPTDLDVRLVLADALHDAGQTTSERFWRWTVARKLVPENLRDDPALPYRKLLGNSKKWGWAFHFKDVMCFGLHHKPYCGDTHVRDTFKRLRQAWDRLRKSVDPVKQELARVYGR